jgi:hypothetical protein
MKRQLFTLLSVFTAALHAELPDVSQWALSQHDESFLQGRTAAGQDALNYWMQTEHFRMSSAGTKPRFTLMERLCRNDEADRVKANAEIVTRCSEQIASMAEARKKGLWMWPQECLIFLLRAPERLTPDASVAIKDLLTAWDTTNTATPDLGWSEGPGWNGSNGHGFLTRLSLIPEVMHDERARFAANWALRRTLDHFNTTGDAEEYNCLESHWNGAGDWEVIKRYLTEPHQRRMARMISERVWINRLLMWSPAVERITGPGSRMAPMEWLGCANERFLLATGLKKPIWLNFFIPWEVWDAQKSGSNWPLNQAQAMVPDLPDYLQDIAWHKAPNHELRCGVTQINYESAYPKLKDVPAPATLHPLEYVSYQTENYALGSVSGPWVVNTCQQPLVAFWNDHRSTAPLGSPQRFCALYSHYVFNGMSFLDPGEIFFSQSPDQPLKDNTSQTPGPWMREFIEFGRIASLQKGGTVIAGYSCRPGTHYDTLLKNKVKRASAAMYLLRWRDGTDGLFVNREPVRSLPCELQPGDWWFIEDGDTYVGVRPLAATHLRGPCKTVLEKRTRHIVLYQDNFVGDDITGISDEDWVKAQSGYVVEMGSKREHGSFTAFQDKLLAAKVAPDTADGFTRRIAYQREGRSLEMQWHSYTEEYQQRKVDGSEQTWARFLDSPEFSVSDTGHLAVHDASLNTGAGKTLWLLSAAPSKTWVAYQANAEQELPIEFSSPAGRLTASRFPLGKIVIRRPATDSVKLDIDASYRPFFNSPKRALAMQDLGVLPSAITLETDATRVEVKINGVSLTATREQSGGKAVWRINPYEKPQELNLEGVR